MKRKRAPETPGPAGFLLVDKAPGWTSHDVVNAARRWLGTRRVGHLGTLDPLATGVLPLAIRAATKLAPYISDCRKSYVGSIELGVETDTLDAEGQVVRKHDGALPSAKYSLPGSSLMLTKGNTAIDISHLLASLVSSICVLVVASASSCIRSATNSS